MARQKKEDNAQSGKVYIALTDKKVTEEDIKSIIKIVMDGNNMPIDIIEQSHYNKSRAEFIGFQIQKYLYTNNFLKTVSENEYNSGQVSF